MSCTFCMTESTKELGTRAHQSLTPPARELPCRQYNSSVPRLSLQAFLPSAGCCGSHFVRQFLKNIIAVLCLDVPRTMACCRQGSPLCCLRCRFYRITFAMICFTNFSAYFGNFKENPAPSKSQTNPILFLDKVARTV